MALFGRIKFYDGTKDFGIIICDDDTSYKYHQRNFNSDFEPHAGLRVRFFSSREGNWARSIDPIDRDSKDTTLSVALAESGIILSREESKATLDEISQWKTEAKLEEVERYFYKTSDFRLLDNGSRSYVIGRKGSGKTALCNYILNKSGHDLFKSKLTFKNFPFQLLYKYTDGRYTMPNQYITFWKFLIYSRIARMMASNEAIDYECVKIFKDAFDIDKFSTLASEIEFVTSQTVGVDLGPIGVERAEGTTIVENNSSWIDKVELLEGMILDSCDSSTYFICLDELDEDYKEVNNDKLRQDYIALITGLIKAVQDIRSVFRESKYRIYPIVFLRDDIYSQLRDPDRSKWKDLTTVIKWSDKSLRRMLAYRISRAIDRTSDPVPFNVVWDKIAQQIHMRGNSDTTMLEYMLARTHMRPRDVIRYMTLVASEALSRSMISIPPDLLRDNELEYSEGFRSELEDEINGVFEDTENAINTLSLMGKRMFEFDDYHSIYSGYKSDGDNSNSINALSKLFDFSVIGRYTETSRVFRYQNARVPFYWKDRFVIHAGLQKTLGV